MSADEAADDVVVRGPLKAQGSRVEPLLRDLPEWFGIERAIVEYARAADELPTFVAEARGELIGFVTLRPTTEQATEVHVMAVRHEWHRHGIGTQLVEAASGFARAAGLLLLHVKTLAPSDPDPHYAATRAFYQGMGFIPLEESPQLWGPENPCLLLVKPLYQT